MQTLLKSQHNIEDSRHESEYEVKPSNGDAGSPNHDLSNFSTKGFHDCSFAESSEEIVPASNRAAFEENSQIAWEKQDSLKPVKFSPELRQNSKHQLELDQMRSVFKKNHEEAVKLVSQSIANRI